VLSAVSRIGAVYLFLKGSYELTHFQVQRVAKTRNLPEDAVSRLVADSVKGRTLGIFGEPRVNVLALNLALDSAGNAVRRGHQQSA
jgi:hypothetical protein